MSWIAVLLLAALIAVVAIGGLVFLSYNNELVRARNAASSGALIANTTAGPIEYAEKGTGIPLLSIHGAGGGYDQGLANVGEFMGDGFRVIAPSRFGYLSTPIPPDISPAAQADAHAALLNELRVDKAIVVGISAGARSAVELALRHPTEVAALILIVPGTYEPTSTVSVDSSPTSQLALWLVNVGADFAWWSMEKIAPSMLVRFIGVRPELVAASPRADQERVMQIVRSVEPLSRRFAGINIDSNPNLGPLPLDKINAPTLVISARDDLFKTAPAAEFLASNIRNAKLVIYDTGGHLLVGHEQEVRAVVKDFLAGAGMTSSRRAAPAAVRESRP
jgi:pimeloyl-ACP methyl ester carboxylesterase